MNESIKKSFEADVFKTLSGRAKRPAAVVVSKMLYEALGMSEEQATTIRGVPIKCADIADGYAYKFMEE